MKNEIFRSEVSTLKYVKEALPYRLYMPAKHQKSTKLPLVVWLHGAGERGVENQRQLIHIAPYLSSDSIQNLYPSILFFPQCPQDDYWAPVKRFEWTFDSTQTEPTPAMKKVIHMIEELRKRNDIDTQRIYVGGLSMGGFGTLDLLSRKPEWFAAALPICGGSDLRAAHKYTNTPLWLFHGAQDDVVPVRLSRELYSTLKEWDAPIRYTEFANSKHNVWNEAIKMDGVLAWLFSQRLSSTE